MLLSSAGAARHRAATRGAFVAAGGRGTYYFILTMSSVSIPADGRGPQITILGWCGESAFLGCLAAFLPRLLQQALRAIIKSIATQWL